MRKASTPPAQASWEWARVVHPLSLPSLETHSFSVEWFSLQTWTGTALGPLCVSAGEGADSASSCPNRCSLRNHNVPGCIRNCLEAGASCRCPTLMNHTLSGPGVPNGWVNAEMPGESCPGMHLPPHHAILARQGLSRH